MPSTNIATLDSAPGPKITLPDPVPQPQSRERPSPVRRIWRFVKGAFVFFIVVFHLALLAIRNPLDLWDKPIEEWAEKAGYTKRYGEQIKLTDRFTRKYAHLVGCEQGWCMFSPPMARGGPFFAVRFEFTDGSKELVCSRGEPDPNSFFRVGGWQRRKLEEYLLAPARNMQDDPELGLWEGWARHHIRQWRQNHPDDPRTMAKVVFVKRRLQWPHFEDPPGKYDPPTERDVAAFDARGRLIP